MARPLMEEVTMPVQAVRSGNPSRDAGPSGFTVVVDWLAANGIDEWIPESPTFTVRDGRIEYRAYRFTGPRGYDHGDIVATVGDSIDLHTEARSVPLLVPADAEVRAAFAELAGADPMWSCRLVDAE